LASQPGLQELPFGTQIAALKRKHSAASAVSALCLVDHSEVADKALELVLAVHAPTHDGGSAFLGDHSDLVGLASAIDPAGIAVLAETAESAVLAFAVPAVTAVLAETGGPAVLANAAIVAPAVAYSPLAAAIVESSAVAGCPSFETQDRSSGRLA